MIDWSKPIETVDGRAARVMKTRQQELWHLVWVAPEYEGPGDVYMVNAEGCRCDSRSIEMGLQTSQFIRNVRVKREGWVVARASIAAAPIIERTHLYATQKEAQAGCIWEKSFPMFVSWEE